MSMIKQAMPVTKAEGGKRVPVGEVEIFIPALDEFGITDAPTSTGEDGLPIYAKQEHNWLFGGVLAATKMQARNKLESGSIKVKDGQAIATTLAELLVESERGGNGEYLKAISQLKAKFGAWVATLGKSQKAQDLLKTLFTNKQALALQEEGNRKKFAGYIADFAETLDADTLAAAGRYLEGLVAAATAEQAEAEDF
jgi:hypothetical protein